MVVLGKDPRFFLICLLRRVAAWSPRRTQNTLVPGILWPSLGLPSRC